MEKNIILHAITEKIKTIKEFSEIYLSRYALELSTNAPVEQGNKIIEAILLLIKDPDVPWELELIFEDKTLLFINEMVRYGNAGGTFSLTQKKNDGSEVSCHLKEENNDIWTLDEDGTKIASISEEFARSLIENL